MGWVLLLGYAGERQTIVALANLLIPAHHVHEALARSVALVVRSSPAVRRLATAYSVTVDGVSAGGGTTDAFGNARQALSPASLGTSSSRVRVTTASGLLVGNGCG
jgi:hypothetical protein